MESGNDSTSMQSSNRGGGGGGGGGGGEEEYNSRADQSLSAIINNPRHVSTAPSHPMPNHYHQTHFDNTNNLFIPNFLINSNYNTNPAFPDFLATSAPPHTTLPAHHAPDQNNNNSNSSNCIGVMTKSRKKRTRTSRRAPTTVLTTDTSNFRAMVQEFTGIPGSIFPNSTINSQTSSSNIRLNNFLGFPSLSSSSSSSLLRPLAQRMIIPPFLSQASASASSSAMDHYQTLNLQHTQNQPKPCTDYPTILSSDDKKNEMGVTASSSSKMISKRTEGMVESWICSSDQGI